MVGAGVGVAQPPGDPVRNLVLIAEGRSERAGILEIFVEHEHAGLERPAGGRREEFAVIGGRGKDSDRVEEAVPEYRLPARTVGAPAARQVEARDAGVVEAGIRADDLLAVAL